MQDQPTELRRVATGTQVPPNPVASSPQVSPRCKDRAMTDLQKRQKAQVCEVVDVLTNLTATTILQVHTRIKSSCCTPYMSIISQ